MKSEVNIRAYSSYRLDLVDILKNHTIYMKRQKERDGKIFYVVVDSLEEADGFKIGNHVIDGASKCRYRIFSECIAEKKKYRGKQVYSVDIDKEVNPEKLGRKQIRLYTSNSEHFYRTSILRFYEITYIVNTVRNHEEDNENFRRWISCDERNLQINHITGEYTCSGNASLLEICTRRENLLHGRILRYFRKVNTGLQSAFLATVNDCCLALEQLQLETGSEKVETCDLYKVLVSQNKIIEVAI